MTDDILYCQSFDPNREKTCLQPLGKLHQSGHGKQITTLEGVTITSKAHGGFFINCPACGGGYHWNQTISVPTERVKQLLNTAMVMGWKFIRFDWKSTQTP